MKNKLTIQIGLALLTCFPAFAEVTATVESGFDDNPFRLSEQFNDNEGGFFDSELRFRQGLGNGFRVDARARYLAYTGTEEDADRFIYSALLEYENDTNWFGKKVDYSLRGRVNGIERTFVSRSTGQVGVFSGQEIGNRFNYVSFDGRARADVALNPKTRLRLQLDSRVRRYDDLTDLGLSNLNYNQVYGRGIVRYRPNDDHELNFGAAVGQRNHLNRLGRALDGTFVPDSNLNFTFFEAEARWKYEFIEGHDVQLSYDYRSRSDSVSGYFGTNLHRAGLRYRYRPNRDNRFTARFEYGDLDFVNIPAEAIINNEENVGPNNGFTIAGSYSRRLSKGETHDLWLDIGVSYDDYESLNTNFTFDRLLARAGLTFQF